MGKNGINRSGAGSLGYYTTQELAREAHAAAVKRHLGVTYLKEHE